MVGGWTELAESPAQKQWLHMQGLLQKNKNKNSTEKLTTILESVQKQLLKFEH